MPFAASVIVQKATFDTCGTCIDATHSPAAGSLVIIDSSAIKSGPVVAFTDYSTANGLRNNQLVVENVKTDGSNPVAVTSDGKTVLSDLSDGDTWIWGNVDPGTFQAGKQLNTPRSSSLLDGDGKFFTMPHPTYADSTADDVVNVKSFSNYTVRGHGQTDDSTALNAILAQAAAANQIVYVPYGVYVLRSTLYIPPGTRMVGECWSTFSGDGDAFSDADNAAPVVMVGKPGETGVAQIQDVRFTVADILPGAIIVQVNMAGQNPGDVAFWNSHVTVGGFADSKVNENCGNFDTSDCKAAFALVHLTDSSSTYIENMWGWTADHSLDGTYAQNIATGRGLLFEATKGTWLTGTGFEHNTLYNYNLHSASNVFAGMQQTETPYWQGPGAAQSAPTPWSADSEYGDPDFSWCSGDDQTCRMALAQNIDGGSGLFLCGAAFWTFFQNHQPCDNCIINQARVTNRPETLSWYGIGTKGADVMVLDGGDNPDQETHPGGWGGVIAVYLPFANQS